MRILTGTSGWGYPAWRGAFYEERLPAARMLAAYAARLGTVEVNATAYRMPRPELLAGWRAQVRRGFVFAVKAPQRITHQQRLRRAGAALGRFYAAAAELGDALGPVLFQVPPTLPKDLPLLEEFLSLLPRRRRAAFQLHGEWLSPDVLDALARRGAALCVVDADDAATPLAATADFGYLRLRRLDYDDAALEAWAARLAAQPWSDAFVYFRHEDTALGPRFARRFAELCAPQPDDEGPPAPGP
jgi:uncharacterized protein YecE (DUF72 family)